ncbi:hypothetical protein [Sphingomonas sp. KR3-1]|uniref:hypothetical protein n=1 Tax=Sphingomonas sp. KR3-1 TaxID=3156611 RepID=UPI0032B47C0E
MLNRLHKAPYGVRFSLLALAAVGINMLGLALTQWLGWSLLFFDMIGTAVASLLGGAAVGLVVALISSVLGSLSIHDPTYLVYGYVNIVGALAWSVLPRTGRGYLGCYVFNIGKGATYRRAFSNIVLLGTATGFATSIAAWVITTFILHGHIVVAYGAATATGANNAVLTENLIAITHASDGLAKHFIVLLASMITNIPDKIISTASAVILIISYRTLPNYREQKRIIRENVSLPDAKIVGNRYILLMTCFGQIFLFSYFVWIITKDEEKAGLMLSFSIIVAVLVIMDRIYFRSIDRTHETDLEDSGAFYNVPDDFHMGHHKAVFEDILKLMAIAVSGTSFLIAMSGETACVPDMAESFTSAAHSTNLRRSTLLS